MKYILLLLVLLLFSSCIREDMELYRPLRVFSETADPDDFHIHSDKVFKMLHQNPGKARALARTILDSESGNNLKLEIELLKHIGSSYSIEGNFSEALQYYGIAIQKAEAIDSYEQIADINNNTAVVNRIMGNYKNAFVHFTKAINYYEQTGDIVGKANALSNKGLMYMNLDNYEIARDYLEEALAVFLQTSDTLGILVVSNNLSLIYAYYNDYDTAFEYLEHTLQLARETNNQYILAISYQAKGNIYSAKSQYERAIEAYSISLSIAKESNQPYQLAEAMISLAYARFLAGNKQEALVMTEEAMELASLLNNVIIANRAHYNLFRIHKALENYKKSLDHYTQYNKTKENLLTQTIIHQIYDFEIENLSQINKLKQLEIESKELAISKKNNLLIFTIIAFLLTLSVLYFFSQNHRNRQRARLQKTIADLTEKKSYAAVEAEIQERKRIGQELHDCLGQMLSVAGLHISILQSKKDISDTRKEALLNAAMKGLDEAFAEVRNISHNLAPSLLSERGLEGALKQLTDQVNQSQKLHMSYETFGLNGNLSSLVENSLFRAIQEILNNAIKHSEATALSFQITQGVNDISLMAEDNGKGFDPKNILSFQGSGLNHMKSRVEIINGSLHIDSAPERGTIISIVVPLNPTRNDNGPYKSISS